MKTFKDNLGRNWQISVTVGSAKRVRDLAGSDILQLKAETLKRLGEDPYFLADVFYALVKPEADAAKVSPENFAEGLAGDAVEEATEILLDELMLFFPSAQRKILQDAVARAREAKAKIQNPPSSISGN